MDRDCELMATEAARVNFSWELHEEVQKLIFELGQRVRDQAATLALQRGQNGERVHVTRTDILQAAREVLAHSAADFERGMSTDQDHHVRKAS